MVARGLRSRTVSGTSERREDDQGSALQPPRQGAVIQVSDVVAAAAIAGTSGVLGSLLGGIVGARLEVIRGREAQKARQYEQRVQRQTFERETLLRAQEAAARYADEVGGLTVLVVEARDSPEYREHSTALMKGATDLQMLGARIQDAELRQRAREYTVQGLAQTESQNQTDADRGFKDFLAALKTFNDRWTTVFAQLLEPPT